MSARLLLVLTLVVGCGDDDVAAPAEPTLAALQYERCLPSELRGAGVADAPRLSAETAGRDEIDATYTDGEGVVRVLAVLYRDDAEVEEERASEAMLLEACDRRPECEPRTIGGVDARVVSLGPVGQESTNLFVDPGVRLSVLASPGRSAAFAELVDLDCLRALHGEREGT